MSPGFSVHWVTSAAITPIGIMARSILFYCRYPLCSAHDQYQIKDKKFSIIYKQEEIVGKIRKYFNFVSAGSHVFLGLGN